MTTGPAAFHALRAVPRTGEGRVDLDRLTETVRRFEADARGDGAGVRLLESVPGAPGTGRWSYLVPAIAGRLVWWPGRGAVANGALSPAAGGAGGPLEVLDRACDLLGLDPTADRDLEGPPFTQGLVGGLSYDLARAIEHVPDVARADRALPWFDLATPAAMIAIDHLDEEAVLAAPHTADATPTAHVGALAAAIERAARTPAPPAHAPSTAGGPQRAQTTLPRSRYVETVEALLERIGAGDTFQVNLSQRLSAAWPADVWSLYRALRAESPAPYGAVVPAGDHAIASISPETFLRVDRGTVTVRPIKGTRPRRERARDDERMRDELAGSAKDRAENVMVVDMERNDLGRVCVPGSVQVPRLCDVEAHPTVWHLVSEVTGELRPSTTYADLLRAAFPCGSVTGTPKVKALELIERHEPVRRGWYCGAIGFLGTGVASLSVAIRTATLGPDGTVDYGAGGGVVADSDPTAEHRESLDKAAAFLRALGVDPPGD